MQNALKRKDKEETVEKLTKAFEESTAVFGIRFQHISVSSQCSLLLRGDLNAKHRTSEVIARLASSSFD